MTELDELCHVARMLSKLMKLPGTNMDLKREVAAKLRARLAAITARNPQGWRAFLAATR